MTDPIHSQLIGHLLGALDDDEQEWVEGQLTQDERYRRQGLRWRRRIASLEAGRPEFEPPRGLAERTCQLVAAWSRLVSPARIVPQRWKMTPVTALPARSSHLSWGDVVAVSLVVMVAFLMIFPAIQSSRLQARVATCQNNMRQFGSAMTEYADRHHMSSSQLMADGGLTSAGVAVLDAVEDVVSTERGGDICPDAWLTAQGIEPSGTTVSEVEHVLPVQYVSNTSVPLGIGSRNLSESSACWPGVWRNGTRGDRQAGSLPAVMPLLADDPSARLPGQVGWSPSGKGGNVFFSDGHIRYLPYAAAPTAAEMILSSDLQ